MLQEVISNYQTILQIHFHGSFFSKRTVDLLAPLWGDNVQYLDVNVFYDDGGEIDGKYYAINILDVIKTLNKSKNYHRIFDMGGWKSFCKNIIFL